MGGWSGSDASQRWFAAFGRRLFLRPLGDLDLYRRPDEIETVLAGLQQGIDPAGGALDQRQLDSLVELLRSAHGEGVHGDEGVVNAVTCIG